ncbi:MAG: ATP-binding cassette domain-containing protein, partial [Hyphomicrobiales bacterium]|nr:ATP-binding cassette domain-containing protein [Hyphomicrobiales bacterium]
MRLSDPLLSSAAHRILETEPMDRRPSDGTALDVEALSFGFDGAPVLSDVNFNVRPGEFTVLLGPNGAGKTTLFSLITRLYESRQGSIRINGFGLREQPTKALAGIGVVFQQPTLDLDLTVRQNLLYHGALHGLGAAETGRRAEEELGRLEMLERQAEKVRKLNGGHRRRVEIARALLHRPQLLLLDEPTVGLDVPTRQSIVDHVHALCRDQGIAVLWATHLIDEVATDDSVIVL